MWPFLLEIVMFANVLNGFCPCLIAGDGDAAPAYCAVVTVIRCNCTESSALSSTLVVLVGCDDAGTDGPYVQSTRAPNFCALKNEQGGPAFMIALLEIGTNIEEMTYS
jgi:hypothetical protein